jgi:hypothetical protein
MLLLKLILCINSPFYTSRSLVVRLLLCGMIKEPPFVLFKFVQVRLECALILNKQDLFRVVLIISYLRRLLHLLHV